MAQHFIQARDAILDALRKPAIDQRLYPTDTLTSPSNDQINQIKEKYFSEVDAVNLERVKNFMIQYIKMFENSIQPSIQGLLNNAVVAGGCFTSLLGQGNPKDYDIFILKNDPERDNLLDDLTLHVGNNPERWSMKSTDELNYLSNKNIRGVFTDKHHKAQIMFTDYATREELVDDFDFVHCRISMTLDKYNSRLFVSRETYDAIKKKELIINKKSKTGAKEWRIQKFKESGWELKLS